jgi:hypothetical protein
MRRFRALTRPGSPRRRPTGLWPGRSKLLPLDALRDRENFKNLLAEPVAAAKPDGK